MKLYEHQQRIVNEDLKKCGIFQGTGSGKTRTALMLARGNILVVCPKTQKEDQNWEREAGWFNWIPNVETISKETFRRDHATLPPYDTLIFDEAHAVLGVTPNTRQRKGNEIPRTSQLFEAAEHYIARTKPQRLYLVTATIMRSPMTVWGAARLLGLMWNFYDFRALFYTKLPMPGREVWVPKTTKEAKDKLAELVRKIGYIGRLEDFFDVPAQVFKNDYVELTTPQKDRLKRIGLEFPDPIVRLGKRHSIENGLLNGDEFNPDEIFANEKINKILEYAIEFPKMIVFAKYRLQIEEIAKAVRKAKIPVWTLTGDSEDRGLIIAEVNRAEAGILICQAQISAGWEVPSCPVMIFASRTYSYVDHVQALGRIQRANNIKKNLYINLIVKGGVDEAVHKSLENKQDFDDRLYLNI